MTPLPPPVVFAGWLAALILGGTLGAWIVWQIAFDRGFEEACGSHRHRHRIGAPQETALLEALPREGTLEPLPATPVPPPHSDPLPPWERDLPGEHAARGSCRAHDVTGCTECWTFFGAGVEVQPRPGPAEYELLTAPVMTQTTQTMTVTATTETVEMAAPQETPSAWSRRHVRELDALLEAQALDGDAYRSKMREDSNYFRHHLTARSGHTNGAR